MARTGLIQLIYGNGDPPTDVSPTGLYTTEPYYDIDNHRLWISPDGDTAGQAMRIAGRLVVVSKTANYTATRFDDVIMMDATGGNRTVTLPSAVGLTGKEMDVVKIDGTSSTVTISPDGSETIRGQSSETLTSQYHAMRVVSDGANWLVLFETKATELTPITTITANHTTTLDEKVLLVNATIAARTITLISAVGIAGKEYVIKKIDATLNAVTIDGSGSETIDGSTTRTLTVPNESITIISDGSNWRII